jgi:uncharacterized Zn-finger protein
MRLTDVAPARERLSEKLGNSTWVACPACATAFPVSARLANHATALMHCPNCHTDFRLGDLAR